MKKKNIIIIFVVTILILLIPLIAMQFTQEVKWGFFDFIFMGILLSGTGLAFEYIGSRAPNSTYRVAVGIAVGASLLLVYINAAVGIIGEDNGTNILYFGVLLIGLIGVFLARFRPSGMSRAAFTIAIGLFFVPIAALTFWPEVGWGSIEVFRVFILNSFFVIAFVISGFLFQKSLQL